MWTCALFQSQPTTSRTRCRTAAQPRALRHKTDNATPAPPHTRRRTSILRCSQPDMRDRPTRLLILKGSESLPTPQPIGSAGHSTGPPHSSYHKSTPGRIRTCDLRIRSPLLYPAELRGPWAQPGNCGRRAPGPLDRGLRCLRWRWCLRARSRRAGARRHPGAGSRLREHRSPRVLRSCGSCRACCARRRRY